MKHILLAFAMCGALAWSSMTYAAEVEQEVDHAVTVEDNWEYCGAYKTTGYCPCRKCCGKSDGITASGARARAGHTVATGREFPFGTQLLIDGVVYVVEDRGVKNGCIDVFYDDHQTAWNHGVQYHEVYVLRR